MTDHYANLLSRLPRFAYLMSAGPFGSGIFNRPPAAAASGIAFRQA